MSIEILELTPGSVQQTINVYKPKYAQKIPLPFVIQAQGIPLDVKRQPQDGAENQTALRKSTLKLTHGQYFNYMHIYGYKDLGDMEVLILYVNQEDKNSDKNLYHLILSCSNESVEKAKNFVATPEFKFESSLQTFIAGTFLKQ